MSLSTETSKQVNQKINDPAGTFFAYVWVGFFVFLAILCLFSGDWFAILIGTPFFIATAYPFFLIAKTKAEGTTISVDDKTISYPGGSIAAESVTDYFTPSFWLQSMKIHTTKFEDITQLSTTCDQTIFNKIRQWCDKNNKNKYEITETSYKYGVEIQGTFGAATIYFKSIQKRDQLFGLLRQNLKAGMPVINAQG